MFQLSPLITTQTTTISPASIDINMMTKNPFYDNIVNKLHNPINYSFYDRDVIKCDHIDYLTTCSHITIPNLEQAKATCAKSKELGLFNLIFTKSLC